MAYVGKIFPQFTHIEIDEQGHIWQILNNLNPTVIEDLEHSAHGEVSIDDAPNLDDFILDDDPLDDLWIDS